MNESNKQGVMRWSGIVAGPIAWFLVLVAGYYLTPDAHRGGRNGLLVGMHAAAFVVAVIGGLLSLHEHRRLARVESSEIHTERARFIAIFGIGLAAMTAALILASALPPLLLPAGAEP